MDADQDGAPSGCLIVVCGLPGSGKTTTASQLAASRAGIRLGADEGLDALGVTRWDEDARARVEALQWSLTQELLALGLTVVIEWGTWSRRERDTLRRGARALGASVELHHLEVPLDELSRRIAERNAETPPITAEDLRAWWDLFERPDVEEMARYDNGQ